MSGAVLEVEREESFRLPGDDEGPALAVVRLRGSDSMWATASALAAWFSFDDPRAVMRQIRSCGASIADYVAVTLSATAGGAIGRPREVAVYSEGAWEAIAERGRTERAKALHALFRRAVLDELRLMRAAMNGPLPYTRAVLALALKRLRPVAEAMPEGDHRDLVTDVANRLAEDRQLVALAKEDVLVAEASRASIAHRLPRGPVDVDPAKSQAAKDSHTKRRNLAAWGGS